MVTLGKALEGKACFCFQAFCNKGSWGATREVGYMEVVWSLERSWRAILRGGGPGFKRIAYTLKS